MRKRRSQKEIARDDQRKRTHVEALHAELQGYGWQFLGNQIPRLEAAVLALRQECAGKPRCYGRSWEPRNPECGHCDFIDRCSDLTIICDSPVPHVVTPCPQCDGDVMVELFRDYDSKIIGHACSTPGCSHFEKIDV